MKKILAILLAVVMVVCGALVLTGCGGNNDTTTDPSADASAENTDNTAKTVKAGFIFLHDENSTYDLNFLNAAEEACQKLGVEYICKKNIDESNACYEAAAELVDSGCNVIFADSFGHEDFMIKAAKEFPDVEFCHATGTKAHTEGLDNYHNAFASIYEGRYLAGVAAGLKLNEMIENGEFTAEEAKMGYVGAFTYAEVISGYTSFYLGAKSVCPTVTMDVQFTGSWYDETAEKEAATVLINKGCKLISQHADSMGAPTACEEKGIPNICYNGSTQEACPNTYIVASKINWAPYFEYMINCVANGEKIAADWTGTIATGSVQLTELNTNVAAEGTAEKLAEVQASIEDGSLKVFDTAKEGLITKDGAALESYMADVDTDPDYTPDTEAVIDGYFHESEMRSAPYFDVQIDGITLLNSAF
ncbi:MAG: BMP family ABC transporter substrate-binding protein [Acutalibacteraceae bacterium]